MKKANILCLLSAALITASCSTDFLNTKSQTEIMAEDIWKEKNLAEAYMYDIYFASKMLVSQKSYKLLLVMKLYLHTGVNSARQMPEP